MELFGVVWAQANYLWLLPLFIAAGVLVVWRYAYLKKIALLLVHPTNMSLILANFSLRRQAWKMVLLLAALASLFLALLRPQWTQKEQEVMQEGRDLLVVFDVSRSMLARDLRPDRLTFAKLKVRHLLEKLSCERVGLILFSGSAFVQCPLTSDYGAFNMFLENISTEAVSSGSTALDKALDVALSVFERMPDRKHKLILLVTDGEDFSADMGRVTKKAQDQGAVVCALGIGSIEGAPVPRVDVAGAVVGHETDAVGKPVLTRLNEELLHRITEQLHGRYLRARYEDTDLDEMVAFVNTFEREIFEEQKFSYYEERYPWFVAAGLLALVLEWVL